MDSCQFDDLYVDYRLNIVNAKVNLVSATYKVLGCAALFFIGGAASMGPYIERSIVHDTVNEVEQRLQRYLFYFLPLFFLCTVGRACRVARACACVVFSN